MQAVISYTGDNARDLVEDDGTPVTSRSGVYLAANWSTLWTDTPLNTSLYNAGVTTASVVFTGTWYNGYASTHNCREWTSTDTIAGGRGAHTKWRRAQWASNGNYHCFARIPFLCACSGISSPTAAPAALTTAAPTLDTTGNYLYLVNPGVALGALGGRAATNSLCSTGSEAAPGVDNSYGAACATQPFAVLCYSGGDDLATMASRLGFDPAAPLQVAGSGTTGTWGALVTTPLGITGCDGGGYTASNCGDFSTTAGTVSTSGASCGSTQVVYCACMQSTPAPTAPTCPPLAGRLLMTEEQRRALTPACTPAPTTYPTPYPVAPPPPPPPPGGLTGTTLFAIKLGVNALGTLGNRAATDAACRTYPDYVYPNYGSNSNYYYGAQCPNAVALLCYSGGDDIANLPANHGFDPSTPVHGYPHFPSGPWADWGGFLAARGPSMAFADGCDAAGHTSNNCADFSTTAGSIDVDGFTTNSCSANMNIFCVCPAGGATQAPTPPTQAPTRSPTPPGLPYSFLYAVHLGGTPVGTIGNRAASTAICKGDGDYIPYNYGVPNNNVYGAACADPLAFMCYSGGDDVASMPEVHGFDRAAPVVTTLFHGTLAWGNWTNFTSNIQQLPPQYSGCNNGGHLAVNCADFTQGAGTNALAVTQNGGGPAYYSTADCGTGNYLFCICPAGGSLAPTSGSPTTPEPTTQEPTSSSPTARPTCEVFGRRLAGESDAAFAARRALSPPGCSTPNPTVFPTAFPTNQPTVSPGTLTIFSTTATAAFAAQGPRATMDGLCAADAQAAACGSVAGLACFSAGYDALSIPAHYGFSAGSPVYYNYGIFASWADYLGGNVVAGCNSDGTTGSNCADFTSPSGSVSLGGNAPAACTDVTQVTCLCIPAAPITDSPTPYPTVE